MMPLKSKYSNPCFSCHFLLLFPRFSHHSITILHVYTHPRSFSYFPNIHHLRLRVHILAPSPPIISQTPSFYLSTHVLPLLSPASRYLLLPFEYVWDLTVLRQLRWQMGRDGLYCVVGLIVNFFFIIQAAIWVVEEFCGSQRNEDGRAKYTWLMIWLFYELAERVEMLKADNMLER